MLSQGQKVISLNSSSLRTTEICVPLSLGDCSDHQPILSPSAQKQGMRQCCVPSTKVTTWEQLSVSEEASQAPLGTMAERQ